MDKTETIAVTVATKEIFGGMKEEYLEKRQEKQSAKDNFDRQSEALALDIELLDKQLAALGESIK